jgi:branched-subunit amino acid transport protein
VGAKANIGESMNTFEMWLAMALVGAVTFTYRWSFVFLLDRIRVPAWLRNALRFVPIAALSAIITPELFVQTGQFNSDLFNPRLIAAVIASGVALRTRNVLLTIAIGMLALWVLQLLA